LTVTRGAEAIAKVLNVGLLGLVRQHIVWGVFVASLPICEANPSWTY
jgi:hypothetical protein